MVLTPTTKIELGFSAPKFKLFNPLKSDWQSLDELKSNKATLVIFMCNHCPYVVHVLDGIVQLADDYLPKGVAVIAINSNDVSNYPDDSPEKMVSLIREYNIPFPYLAARLLVFQEVTLEFPLGMLSGCSIVYRSYEFSEQILKCPSVQ